MSFWPLPTQTAERTPLRRPAQTRLTGQLLILARGAWVILVLLILGLFVASLPASLATLHQPCASGPWCALTGQLTASQMHSLLQAGLSLDAYVWSWIVFTGGTALVWVAVGGILFLRKSDDWMVLLVALMLISVGVTFVTDVLLFSSSAWRIPEDGLYLLKSMALVLTLALFPNGRFVPRWAGGIVLIYPAYVLSYVLFLRPLYIPGWTLYSAPINAAAWFGSSITLTLAQLYRYVRVSSSGERQQTKWVAFGFLVSFLLGDFGVSAASNLLPLQHLGWLYVLLPMSFSLLLLLIPLSLLFAMLRSHLWDIDTIINKTLVYGLLSVLLAAIYAGLVLGLQALLGGLLHQTNAIALVVSTLVIVALFQPLHHRIQAVIDHRFYRRKYNTQKTLAAFSATLRNEVDLSQLQENLLTVVKETMQPAHVSLWLRPPDQSSEWKTRVFPRIEEEKNIVS